MVRRRAFGRGDIVAVDLNPTVGREIRNEADKPRLALVLSSETFNALGMVLIVPITQGGELSRVQGFAVTLSGAGTRTQGVAVVNMARMVDLEARAARRVETAPDVVVNDALARLAAILE